MIILTETTDNLQAVLAGSVTTNQLQCFASWRDVNTTDYIPGRTLVNTNNTTDVNIVTSPATDTKRVVDFLSIYNRDTVNATVTVKMDANATEYILWKGILAAGETLQYNDKTGFSVLTLVGAVKTSQTVGSNNPVINALNVVVLASDVINNNATLNTLADVTGMSFGVLAGQTYWFEFVIQYTAAATSTGSRWTLNGPSITQLAYTSEYALTATTKTTGNLTAFQLPTACNATSATTTGNIATVWGFFTPSENGTLQLQFASEVANSAITAKEGSTLRWIRVV